MNLHPYFFRMPIRREFSQEEYGRVIYFEREYHTHGLIRPNTVKYINHENTITDENESIAITYRDDGLIDLNWVQVSYLKPGFPGAKEAFEKIVSRLKEKVPTYNLDELLEKYRNAPAEQDGMRLFAVYATAVGAPWEFSQVHFEALSEYAQDAKSTVRAGVVIGIGYIGQTEYEPLLKELAADKSKEVADRANTMLEDYEKLKESIKKQKN